MDRYWRCTSLRTSLTYNLNSAHFWGTYIIQVPHPDPTPSLELQQSCHAHAFQDGKPCCI